MTTLRQLENEYAPILKSGQSTYSQNREDRFFFWASQAFFHSHPQYFLDIGSGDGQNLSNSYLLRQMGWDGLCVDANPGPNPAQPTMKEFIHIGSIGPIVDACGNNPTILTIDIDGNDYWILEELLKALPETPALVCAEINPAIPEDKPLAMRYNISHTWGEDNYFGMSFGAAVHLYRQFNLVPIALIGGINLIGVRKDLLIAKGVETDKLPQFRQKHDHPPTDLLHPVYVNVITGEEVEWNG